MGHRIMLGVAAGFVGGVFWIAPARTATASEPAAASEPIRGSAESKTTAADGEEVELEAGLEDVLRSITHEDGWTLAFVINEARSRSPLTKGAEAVVAEAAALQAVARSRLVPALTIEGGYERVSDVDNPELFPGLSSEALAELESDIASLDDPAAQALWRRQVDFQQGLSQGGFAVIVDRFFAQASVRWDVVSVLFEARQRLNAAGHVKAARNLDLSAATQQVDLQAAVTFYTVVRSAAQEQLAMTSRKRRRSLEREMRERVRLGVDIEANALRASARTARAEARLARARANRAVAEDRLRALLDRGPGEQVLLQVAFRAPSIPTFDDAWRTARAQRPALSAAETLVKANQVTSDAVSLQRLPSVVLGFTYRVAQPNPRVIPPVDELRDDWAATVSLSWSPNTLWTGTAQREASVARVRRAQADAKSVRRQVRREVAQARAELTARSTEVEAGRAGLAATQQAYAVRRGQLAQGVITFNDVVEAEDDLQAAEVRLIDALVGRSVAAHQLDRAVGRTFRGVEP